MSTPKQRDTSTDLSSIAKRALGEAGLSTKDISKELTESFYNLKEIYKTKEIPGNDPFFANIALLDFHAARTKAKINNIDTHLLLSTSGSVSAAVQSLGLAKETLAHQATYDTAARPLIADVNKIELEKDAIERDFRTFLDELHTKLPDLIKETTKWKVR